MHNNGDIIVLSKPTGRAENLVFLFRLANYQVTHITDDNEAFNYLVQRQQGTYPASLLLIIDAKQNQPLLQMLDKLERYADRLSVLLAYAEKPLALEQITDQSAGKNFIHQCRINECHSYIRETLQTYPLKQSKVS